MAEKTYPRLNITPHWATTNWNLVEIIGLVPEDKLDWTPAPSEWSIRVIVVHMVLARYHGVTAEGAPPDYMARVVAAGRTKAGLQEQMAESWQMLERFLSDEAKLDAVYAPLTANAPDYVNEPDRYDGHYIAYHRFAHDIHHRSTIIGHLRAIGVSIADHLIRPLD
jgi:uncharacterized damage-inducible protein DinB